MSAPPRGTWEARGLTAGRAPRGHGPVGLRTGLPARRVVQGRQPGDPYGARPASKRKGIPAGVCPAGAAILYALARRASPDLHLLRGGGRVLCHAAPGEPQGRGAPRVSRIPGVEQAQDGFAEAVEVL